jgi:hypothetical protein
MKRFLDVGSPIEAIARVDLGQHQSIKVIDAKGISGEVVMLPGALGRVHSEHKGMYTVWLLDERTMHTIIVAVPLSFMSVLFRPSSHGVFPHFA